MPPRIRSILARVGSFLLAGGLLYLALRHVDFAEVGRALRTADYRWLIPVAVVTLLSHWFRAWRWKILLEALPADDPAAAPKRVSIKVAFYSVMIGYMVNYAAPRLGEVVRSANMARQEDISLARVFGTVVVERLLDVAVLALALISVGFLLADRFGTIEALFIDPILRGLARLPLATLLAVGAVLVAVGVFLYYRLVHKRQDGTPGRLKQIIDSFRAGLVTLLHTPHKGALLVSTVLIWFCYTLMAYLPFVIFHMETTYGISLLDAWSIMNLGAIGVAIPSPGGTGSYHYITIQTLVHLFSVDEDAAASYAILTHAGQLVLYCVVGALCLMLQGSSLRSLKQAPKSEAVEPK